MSLMLLDIYKFTELKISRFNTILVIRCLQGKIQNSTPFWLLDVYTEKIYIMSYRKHHIHSHIVSHGLYW